MQCWSFFALVLAVERDGAGYAGPKGFLLKGVVLAILRRGEALAMKGKAMV